MVAMTGCAAKQRDDALDQNTAARRSALCISQQPSAQNDPMLSWSKFSYDPSPDDPVPLSVFRRKDVFQKKTSDMVINSFQVKCPFCSGVLRFQAWILRSTSERL